MRILILFLCLSNTLSIAKANEINKPTVSLFGFIENKGQIIDQNNNLNSSVRFLYNGNNFNVQLKQTGFSYEILEKHTKPKANRITNQSIHKFNRDTIDFYYKSQRIDISFLNANTDAEVIATDIADDYLNYYTTGTGANGVINVKHYNKVIYKGIYDNIDVEFLLNDPKNFGKFKYNIIVHPGGNLSNIKLLIDGADETNLTSKGEIKIKTTHGEIIESIPLSYQLIENNVQFEVKTIFKQISYNTYGVKAESYDTSKSLIIDPAPWSTYYGGNNFDYGQDVSIDQQGNILVTGSASSTTNIATTGAFQTTFAGGNYDAFIVKFNNSCVRSWSTYYGGSDVEFVQDIVSDTGNNLIITGFTSSTTGISSAGAFQQTYGGGNYDAFIAKFGPTGLRQWSTYYGGIGVQDQLYGAVTDNNGNIYLAGSTNSSGLATTGAYQTSLINGNGAIIVSFSSSGARLWATYFGRATTSCYGIAIDTSNNLAIVGTTNATTGMATAGAYQQTFGGGTYDAYVARFNTGGSFLWCTYFGGTGNEVGYGVSMDRTGNICITGQTTSLLNISSPGAHQTVQGGGTSNAFIARFNLIGNRLWSTFYGGGGSTYANAIASDLNGNIYITGYTTSATAIATTGSFQPGFSGGSYDGFVVKFNPSGVRLWGSYFGGPLDDQGFGIAADASGNVVLTGETNSTSQIATTGAFQTTIGGVNFLDAFVAYFTTNGGLPVKLLFFDAELSNDNNAICKWATSNEINNDYFEIERYDSREEWYSIGKIKGNGTTSELSKYSFTDINPITGSTYFRLKQVDYDGTFSYSEIAEIKLNNIRINDLINLYPNPSNGNFVIDFNGNTDLKTIKILDVLGKVVKDIITSNPKENINDNRLENGIYFIKIVRNGQTKYFNILIN